MSLMDPPHRVSQAWVCAGGDGDAEYYICVDITHNEWGDYADFEVLSVYRKLFDNDGECVGIVQADNEVDAREIAEYAVVASEFCDEEVARWL